MNARPDPITFLPMTPALRARIEATVEHLVALLDRIDGDPDLEPSLGYSPYDENDLEGDDCDLEIDNDDEWSGEELDEAWVEKWGQGADEFNEKHPDDGGPAVTITFL
jgi:hypothetical protein